MIYFGTLIFWHFNVWPDYFFRKNCLSCFADDNTPFVFEPTPENIVSSLESYSSSLFEWILSNQMKAHSKRCHLLMNLMNINRPATITIGEHNISNSYCEKVLVLKSIINSILAMILKLLLKRLHFMARTTWNAP